MATDRDQLQQRILIYRFFVWALVIVGAGFALVGMFWFGASISELDSLGSFLAGTTGILWSLAGMLVVYKAFLGQQSQLLVQQEDLRVSRDALEMQQAEMKAQTELLATQSFETSFFNLLNAHERVVAGIEVDVGYGNVTGTKAFGAIYEVLRGLTIQAQRSEARPEILSYGLEFYEELYQKNEHVLGPYFRSLFNLVKYVDEQRSARMSFGQRRRYVNLVRARLGHFELALLLYNGLTDRGQAMRNYMVRYGMLKHIREKHLLSPHHLLEYPPSTYGRKDERRRLASQIEPEVLAHETD